MGRCSAAAAGRHAPNTVVRLRLCDRRGTQTGNARRGEAKRGEAGRGQVGFERVRAHASTPGSLLPRYGYDNDRAIAQPWRE